MGKKVTWQKQLCHLGKAQVQFHTLGSKRFSNQKIANTVLYDNTLTPLLGLTALNQLQKLHKNPKESSLIQSTFPLLHIHTCTHYCVFQTFVELIVLLIVSMNVTFTFYTLTVRSAAPNDQNPHRGHFGFVYIIRKKKCICSYSVRGCLLRQLQLLYYKAELQLRWICKKYPSVISWYSCIMMYHFFHE